MSEPRPMFEPRLARRRRTARWAHIVFAASALTGVAFLGVLLVRVISDGGSWVSWKFITHPPSDLDPNNCGAMSALAGTLWLITLTAVVSVPVGIASAVYLEEYAPNNRFTRFIHVNISNLAGVPSIVYGILGLGLFVRSLGLGRSVLAGALTLSLLILPVIIIASREALRAVPKSFRLAAYALGASRWQTVWTHVLPPALPGIMTGIILAISRALGEAAPLILLGALTYVRFAPHSPFDPFTAMPVQIYSWCDRPDPEFQSLAAAGILVLLGVLLPLNALAVAIRVLNERKKAW